MTELKSAKYGVSQLEYMIKSKNKNKTRRITNVEINASQ